MILRVPMSKKSEREQRGGPAILDGEPAWLTPVRQGFARVAALEDNWDGEGARRIAPAMLERALKSLEQLLPRHAFPPNIVPTHQAGIQFEWHRSGKDLEIELAPSGETTYYYYDSATKDEREGAAAPDLSNVRAILEQIV